MKEFKIGTKKYWELGIEYNNGIINGLIPRVFSFSNWLTNNNIILIN